MCNFISCRKKIVWKYNLMRDFLFYWNFIIINFWIDMNTFFFGFIKLNVARQYKYKFKTKMHENIYCISGSKTWMNLIVLKSHDQANICLDYFCNNNWMDCCESVYLKCTLWRMYLRVNEILKRIHLNLVGSLEVKTMKKIEYLTKKLV